jgi:hypothetical protein
MQLCCYCVGSLLLSVELLGVEIKFFALENVSIASSTLSWAGRNASVQSTGTELFSNLLVDDSTSGVFLELGKNMSGSLGFGSGLVALLDLLLVEVKVILLKVPLSEGIGINGHDAVLHDGLGSDELVVGSVINDIKNSGLSGDGLGTPGEISSINSECSVLHVGSSSSDWSNSFLAQFGHGWLSTHLELSLLLMNWHTSTCGPSFVSRVSVNSHDPDESIATLYNNNE